MCKNKKKTRKKASKASHTAVIQSLNDIQYQTPRTLDISNGMYHLQHGNTSAPAAMQFLFKVIFIK